MFIVGPLMGRLVTKIGPKPILILGGIHQHPWSFAVYFLPEVPLLDLTIDVAVALVGVVSLIIPIVNMISVSVPKRKHSCRLRNEHYAEKPRRSNRPSPRHHNNFHIYGPS